MRPRSIPFALENGFIHNWLVGGPQQIPLKPELTRGKDYRQKAVAAYHDPDSGIQQTPVERGPLTEGNFQVGEFTGSWNYYACREDHFVDFSTTLAQPSFVRSWAYTQLESKRAQDVQFILFTFTPLDLWINNQLICNHTGFSDSQPARLVIKTPLNQGKNKILLRLQSASKSSHRMAAAMQVTGMENTVVPSNIDVSIPSLIVAAERRNNFERVANQTFIKQDVFEAQDQIRLYWSPAVEKPSAAVVRLMTASGTIYAEATVDGTPADELFLQTPYQIPEGPYRIVLMPLAWEYYERNTRITHQHTLWNLGRYQYSSTAYTTYLDRAKEALQNAALRQGIFAEIAKMALEQWTKVTEKLLKVNPTDYTPEEILGLLGMMYRFSENPQFPLHWKQPLEDLIINYPYSFTLDEDEGMQILSLAAQILAGQRYPEHQFTFAGKSGQALRQQAEQFILAWLTQKGAEGFACWNAQNSFAQMLIALSHLVDLAETQQVWEMAAVVMDKIFLSIALNSFQGVFGSTHGHSFAAYLKGGLLEPTSGITRLMWGTGIFNHHIAAPVSLACTENYDLPEIITNIAISPPNELWNRECHRINASRVVNTVTYKTHDFMLSSAQDFYAGEAGSQEHIWQATLSKNAVVFVNHPACSSESEAVKPNFWAGNTILPRVAQWKDTLIAIYRLPDNDWMGFTHAYFPIYAFDEYTLHHNWAFARKSEGYLALYATNGLTLTQTGNFAFRELRSHGKNITWLCLTGSAALDGAFSAFQQKVLALPLQSTDDTFQITTLRNEQLSFGWKMPFLKDGIEQPLSGFPHYQSACAEASFPCSHIEIRYGENIMRLDFTGTPPSQASPHL